MTDIKTDKGLAVGAAKLEQVKIRLANLQTDNDRVGYAREVKRLAKTIENGRDPAMLGPSLDICLAGISQLLEYGRSASARAALDLLWKPIKRVKGENPVNGRFLQGWALTILGDIESGDLAMGTALKTYRKAVATLSYQNSPAFYLPNALIRKGFAELTLGKIATARKTLENARALLQRHIDDNRTAAYTVLQMATTLSLLGYTWLLSGRNLAKARDLFTQSCELCRTSSDRKLFEDEFKLAEISALSGISSVDFMQKQYGQAEEHALQVANALREIIKSVPGDVQVAQLAPKALIKLAAMTRDPGRHDVTSDIFAEARGLLSHLEQILEMPTTARHAMAVNSIVRARVAWDNGKPLGCQFNAHAGLKMLTKLSTKVKEPDFIAREIERLCGTLPGATDHPLINISGLKPEEPIRGQSAIVQALPPVTDIADMVEILGWMGI